MWEFFYKNLLAPAILGILGGFFGYIFGYRKNKVEISKAEEDIILKKIEGLKEIIDSYQTFSNKLEERLEKQTKIIEEQDIKLETQSALIDEQTYKLKTQSDLIEILEEKIQDLNTQIENQCTICIKNKHHD